MSIAELIYKWGAGQDRRICVVKVDLQIDNWIESVLTNDREWL